MQMPRKISLLASPQQEQQGQQQRRRQQARLNHADEVNYPFVRRGSLQHPPPLLLLLLLLLFWLLLLLPACTIRPLSMQLGRQG